MNLKFEVEDRILRQKNSRHHHKDLDNLFCSFVFTTPDWKHIEKYAIFWNRKGKSTIRSLGNGMRTQCPIPKMVLNDLYFKVQVYANDRVLTQKLKVFTYDDIPVDDDRDSKKILNHFFKKMEQKIDNIVYDDNKLLVYINNELVKTIDVVDEGLLDKIFNGLAPQFIVDQALSADSDLPISSKAVYAALEEKLDRTSLPAVALTGDYNDLNNIPEYFPPEQHTHSTDDIENWDDSVENDLENLLDNLIDEL